MDPFAVLQKQINDLANGVRSCASADSVSTALNAHLQRIASLEAQVAQLTAALRSSSNMGDCSQQLPPIDVNYALRTRGGMVSTDPTAGRAHPGTVADNARTVDAESWEEN